MQRRLIDYLPEVIRRTREYVAALDIAEQPELELLWGEADRLTANQYILELDAYGAGRWEKMLGIARKAGDTLEDRRFRIWAHLNATLPYTMTRLRQMLDELLGADGYTLRLENDAYTLVVRIELSVKSQFDTVGAMLRRVVPANMVIDMLLLYTPHETLKGLTHAHLAQYTHDEIRNEVMDGA